MPKTLWALAVYTAKAFIFKALSIRMIIRYKKIQLEKYQWYRNIFSMLQHEFEGSLPKYCVTCEYAVRQLPSRHSTAEGVEEWTPHKSHVLLLTTPRAFIRCQYSTSWCGSENYSKAIFPLRALPFLGLCLLCVFSESNAFFFPKSEFTNQLLCRCPLEEFCGRIPSPFFTYLWIWKKLWCL